MTAHAKRVKGENRGERKVGGSNEFTHAVRKWWSKCNVGGEKAEYK